MWVSNWPKQTKWLNLYVRRFNLYGSNAKNSIFGRNRFFKQSTLHGWDVFGAVWPKWLNYLFSMWPLTTKKNYQISRKCGKVDFKKLAKYKINPQRIASDFYSFHKVAIFCQIWSHWFGEACEDCPRKWFCVNWLRMNCF